MRRKRLDRHARRRRQLGSRKAAERLPSRFDYALPASYGLLFTDCAVDLMAQTDPTQEPDAACIDEMTPTWVLPE